ncbi:MAG: hypothetical protein LQ346_005214 [Caloplaca aetnensis]|nr:MAG: hypothetical protein LQ346_005214 [Caloplaca aetnensis]
MTISGSLRLLINAPRLDDVVEQMETAYLGVRVVLIGHSMGGFVAAGTVFGLTAKLRGHTSIRHISGILAFDTPFLGVNPGVLANGAETSSSMVQSVGATMTRISQDILGWSQDLALVQRWIVYLLCASAVSIGTKILYSNKDAALSTGSTWASSHMQFVSQLVHREKLQRDLASLVRLHTSGQAFFFNLVTALCPDASKFDTLDRPRTFCILPPEESSARSHFHIIMNSKSASEIQAHTQMFQAPNFPGYYAMRDLVISRIVDWVSADRTL